VIEPLYDDPEVVSDEELAERKKTMKLATPPVLKGYMKRYSKLVSSADKGAVLTN